MFGNLKWLICMGIRWKYLFLTQLSLSNFPCRPWVEQMWDALEAWNNAPPINHNLCLQQNITNLFTPNCQLFHTHCRECCIWYMFGEGLGQEIKLLVVGVDLRGFGARKQTTWRKPRHCQIFTRQLGTLVVYIQCTESFWSHSSRVVWRDNFEDMALAKMCRVVFLGKWEAPLNPGILLCPRPVVGRQVRVAGIGWGGRMGIGASSSLVAILHPPFPPSFLVAWRKKLAIFFGNCHFSL